MAASGTSAAGPMSLILGAVDDQVVPYADAESGYEQTPGEKLWWLNNAGHLAFSDLCAMGSDQGGLVVILQGRGSRYRARRVIWSSVSAPTDALKVNEP